MVINGHRCIYIYRRVSGESRIANEAELVRIIAVKFYSRQNESRMVVGGATSRMRLSIGTGTILRPVPSTIRIERPR